MRLRYRARLMKPWTHWIGLALAIAICVLGWSDRSVQALDSASDSASSSAVDAELRWVMPPARAHPLPDSLAQWHDPNQGSDYLNEVAPTPAGYLVWSHFPVRVYVESATAEAADSVGAANARLQRWRRAVLRGIDAWSAYLPLQYVTVPESANIKIWSEAPPLRYSPQGELMRARSAETRYELHTYSESSLNAFADHARLNRSIEASDRPILMARCQIWISPGQSNDHIAATARHEMGHALGIWGHSPDASDALYFSQVRSPQPLSSRDINTLKRLYQQPTQIGWPWIPSASSSLD